jgi:hypothetical protein
MLFRIAGRGNKTAKTSAMSFSTQDLAAGTPRQLFPRRQDFPAFGT